MNAPVALVVYNRPEHTARTLEALCQNHLAQQSRLYIYSDAARTRADAANVEAVRSLIRGASGFKQISLIERPENLGLAKNIIGAVSEVCAEHGKVILVEDDLVTSQNFLQFMNKALDQYEGDPRVWHLSGWTYPFKESGLGDAFFWPVMNCWGWATWADRWAHYRKDPADLLRRWSLSTRRTFNLENTHPFFSQVIGNYLGRNDTWAVFWYATIFEHQGLCLTPTKSLVVNIGADGSGTHQPTPVQSRQQALGPGAAVDWASTPLPATVQNEPLALERVKHFFHSNISWRDRLVNAIKTGMPAAVYRAMKPPSP